MNTLPSWKKLRNPDPKTITSPVGVPRRPGFRALDSTCMKFSKFIKKHLTIYLQTRLESTCRKPDHTLRHCSAGTAPLLIRDGC